MKIALLGAPGSGKSKLAVSIAKTLRKDGEQWTIVDDYIDNLKKSTGYEFDFFATYAQNFQILFRRWTEEQNAEHTYPDTNLITVGSPYETILYTALKVNATLTMKEATPLAQLQGQVAMQALGLFEAPISNYDLMFFLPYDAPTRLEKGKSYDTVIDVQLPEIVGGYYKYLATLDGNHKAKTKRAQQIIGSYRATQAEEASGDEGLGARGSGSDDRHEQSGPRSLSLPNV